MQKQRREVQANVKQVTQESKMFRKTDSTIPMMLIIACLGGVAISACSPSHQEVYRKRNVEPIREAVRAEESPSLQSPATGGSLTLPRPQTEPEPKGVTELPIQANPSPASTSPEVQKKEESIAPPPQATVQSGPPLAHGLPPKGEVITRQPIPRPLLSNSRDERRVREEETERDVMEEALLLLDESQKYWVNGELEDAIQMLDQAYALLLDTNGNPDIVRQKDDLRLMISKRILAVYNSHPSVSKGKRGEVPILTNPDVEKEIRQFQTVERDFFISSYQRSRIYRPVIMRELKKAGLPEELSWLPLVESGYKINALSSARALGLWQFIPSTGYKYGLNRDDWVDERMDVEKSTRAAIDYFKDLHAMFGDWLTVLAGYNCGEGRVMRTIASQHINYLDRFWDLYQRLPYETARYVPRFVATLLIVRDPQKYGMELGPSDPKADISSYEIAEINRSMRLQDIAQRLEVPEETIHILNAELRHRVTPDRPYKLKVPAEKAELMLKTAMEIPSAERPRLSSQALRGVFIKHKVRQGETLASIAEKYKTSAEAIRSANKLSKKGLVAGQRLNIPIRSAKAAGSPGKAGKSGKAMSHKVQKGDTLASISRQYGIPVLEIRNINGLKSDNLKIGQTLQLGKNVEVGQPEDTKSSESIGKKENVKSTAKASSPKASESTAARRYTVKKGDSLNRIARENNITLEKLIKLNGLGGKTEIHPGQTIILQ